MKLVRKIRLKINQRCKDYLEFVSERCRLIYNFALAEKIEHYKKTGKFLNTFEQKKQLPMLKKKYPEYTKVYNKCLSAMYFRLDKAYKAFFKKHNKFPKFKRKGEFVSQEYPAMFIKAIDKHRFILPTGSRNENFICRTMEEIPDKFSTLIIQKDKDNYFACFIIEEQEQLQLQQDDSVLALDLGVRNLAVGFNGKDIVRIPKFSHYTRHIDEIRSKRDKCKKFSRRRKKWNRVLYRQSRRYINRITDYLHKVSHWLAAKYPGSTILVGDLNLKTMIKANQPWFNRIIQNEWRVGKFVELLSYKCKRFGKYFVKVKERNTTKQCSECGKLQDMPLSVRVYQCSCGMTLDRDINSAINIYKKYCMADAVGRNTGVLASASNLNINTFVYV